MERLASLKQLPLFADVEDDGLRQLDEIAGWRSIPEGMVLMDEGEAGDEIYVVVSGSFVVDLGATDKRQVIAEVGAGEILGETALFRRRVERSARVTAGEDSVVLRIGTRQLEQLARTGSLVPRVVEDAVLTTLTERIHRSRLLIDEVLAEPEPKPEQGFFSRLRALVGL